MSAAAATVSVRAASGGTLNALAIGAPPDGVLAALVGDGLQLMSAPAGGAVPDLVLASLPAAGGGGAVQVAQRLGRPLVVDLRTPWALDGRTEFATPVHLWLARRAMQRALRAAALVLVESPDLAQALAPLGVPVARTLAVPRGIDALPPALPPAGADTFELLVQSALQPALHPPVPTADGNLSRRPRQIEPVGATGYYLFSALATIRRKAPAAFARLRVRFDAPLDRTNLDIAEWLEVESAFVTGGEQPRPDAVFVCQHGEVAGARALDVPPALFAALAWQRPLLAALPAGAACDLVQHLAAGRLLPATDSPPLCHAIEAMLADKTAGRLGGGVDRDALQPLQRTTLAESLLRALQATAQGRTPPAPSLWPAPPSTGATAA